MANTTEASRRAGAVLNLLMQRAGVSKYKLGELANVSHTTIYARVKGENWNYPERQRYADIFGVPEDLFDMTVDDAARWLLDNNRFTVLDLREGSDVGSDGTGWLRAIGQETYAEDTLDLREGVPAMSNPEPQLMLAGSR